MVGELKYWQDGEVTTYDNPCLLRVMVLYPENSTIVKNATNKLFAELLDSGGNPITGLTVTGTLTKPDASTEILTYTYVAGVYTANVVSGWTELLGVHTFTAQTVIGGTTYSATNTFKVELTLYELYELIKKHDRKMEGLILSLPPSP